MHVLPIPSDAGNSPSRSQNGRAGSVHGVFSSQNSATLWLHAASRTAPSVNALAFMSDVYRIETGGVAKKKGGSEEPPLVHERVTLLRDDLGVVDVAAARQDDL